MLNKHWKVIDVKWNIIKGISYVFIITCLYKRQIFRKFKTQNTSYCHLFLYTYKWKQINLFFNKCNSIGRFVFLLFFLFSTLENIILLFSKVRWKIFSSFLYLIKNVIFFINWAAVFRFYACRVNTSVKIFNNERYFSFLKDEKKAFYIKVFTKIMFSKLEALNT